MSKLESEIERKVVPYAELLGYMTFKFTTPGTRGVPDRLFINRHGIVVFIELKRAGKKPRKNQEHMLKRMRGQMAPVFATDSVEFACQILDTWRDRLDTRL